MPLAPHPQAVFPNSYSTSSLKCGSADSSFRFSPSLEAPPVPTLPALFFPIVIYCQTVIILALEGVISKPVKLRLPPRALFSLRQDKSVSILSLRLLTIFLEVIFFSCLNFLEKTGYSSVRPLLSSQIWLLSLLAIFFQLPFPLFFFYHFPPALLRIRFVQHLVPDCNDSI